MGLSFLFFKMRYRNRPLGVSSRYDLYAPTITIESIYSLLVVFPNKSGYFFFLLFHSLEENTSRKIFPVYWSLKEKQLGQKVERTHS